MRCTPQQAALSSLESTRPSRASDVEFARQQVERNTKLLAAGAISQREVEQFEAQLRSAEAQLKALDEQVRQQRSQLSYYRVTAPIAGTVGGLNGPGATVAGGMVFVNSGYGSIGFMAGNAILAFSVDGR